MKIRRKTKPLKIASGYGDVDVRSPLSRRYRHVRGKRLQPTCRALRIRYAPALVDIVTNGYGGKPIHDGVVVSKASEARLRAEIQAIAARRSRQAKTYDVADPEHIGMAICAINRAAKRRRDAASSCYGRSAHGLAWHHRHEKEDYYALKDKALERAITLGMAKPTLLHRQEIERTDRRRVGGDEDWDSEDEFHRAHHWETYTYTAVTHLVLYHVGSFGLHRISSEEEWMALKEEGFPQGDLLTGEIAARRSPMAIKDARTLLKAFVGPTA